MSERMGNHLYMYDGEPGRVKNQVTRASGVLRGVGQRRLSPNASSTPREWGESRAGTRTSP